MEPRSVEAAQGWQWIVDGFGLFRKNPLIWIVLTVIYFVIAILFSVIPVIGQILFQILTPVFMAGFLAGSQALDQGEELELAHLFAGFQRHTAQLVTVGGIYLVGVILVVGIIILLGGGAALGTWMMHGMKDDVGPVMAAGAVSGMLFAMLVGLSLLVPLLMAYWFAPALVWFRGLGAVEAMKLSFTACLRNVLPFLIYGVAAMVLMLLGMIPLGLGLVVVVPVMIATWYTSYRDIFPEEEAVPA